MTDNEARVRQAIEHLHYPFNQFTVQHFIAFLENLRQREIILNGAAFDGRIHGLWIRAETADYIFFDWCTHPIHQVHHILHEAGHMVLGHRPHDLASMLSPALLAELTSLIGSSLSGHCRMMELQNTSEEREAEYFVRQLQQQILIAGRLAALTHLLSSIGELNRFTRSLGYGD